MSERTDQTQRTEGIHHVAFRMPDDEAQTAWRDRLMGAGLEVTPRKDRQYVRSSYFGESGGVLFEVATDGTGFTRDEGGSALKLPPWLEEDREFLEERLPGIGVDGARGTTEAG